MGEKRGRQGGRTSFHLGEPQEGDKRWWDGEDGERERMGVQVTTMDGWIDGWVGVWVGGEEKEWGVGMWD